MKTRNLQRSSAAILIAAFLAGNVLAQDSATPAAVQLSYGMPQVLQLAQAKVGDDTIVAYVKNSGTIYSLNASQIVYLKQQGVSDQVITAMLNQRQNVTGTAAPASSTAPQPNSSVDTSTAVAQPTVTYQTVPSSTVYVMPDTQTYNYDAYYYQPYYYPYYAWPYPAVSFSFGFGHGFRGGGFRGGGFHGGFHH